jgi:hypothetical protein
MNALASRLTHVRIEFLVRPFPFSSAARRLRAVRCEFLHLMIAEVPKPKIWHLVGPSYLIIPQLQLRSRLAGHTPDSLTLLAFTVS